MGLFRRQMQSTGLCRMDNCNNSERSSRRFLKTNEAPYQTIGQRTLAATLGYKELSSRHFWLSVLSESISCYLYVFIVCSTRISWTGSIIGHEPNLLAMALASAITMTLLILTFRTVHVNPALTIAFLLTGRIPLIRAIVYIIFHCMSSIAAIALLYSISVTGHAGALGLDNPHPSLEAWQTMIVEFVISFVVTLATYTTCSYSSYSSARQYILEQVSLNSSDLLDLKSGACDKDNIATIEVNGINNKHQHKNNIGALMGSSTMHPKSQQRRPVTTALASSLAIAPRRPLTSSNFQVHPSSKGYISSDTYENSDYEYDYDNHRIYSAQQQSSPELSPSSRVQPIEELMHEESQLLAPNGFAFHMTPCQSFIIGLAYAITSLTGIPASGASLNPARSFGPAFIMNRWDNHWIYWVGPILGAVTAGFLYEFIFNPTRSSSVCYLPKLFRLSAHDMAKVGSKSRLYHYNQKLAASLPDTTNIFPSITTGHRTQPQHFPTMHQHSPTTAARQQSTATNNIMGNNTLFNPSMREPNHQQLIVPSSSLAHLHPNQFATNNLDQINYLQQQRQHQQHGNQISHDGSNLDHRSKSSAIINLIASKHQQSTINMPHRNNFHSNSSSGGSTSQDFGPANNGSKQAADVMVLYDDPSEQKQQFIGQFNPNSSVVMQQRAGPLTAPTHTNGTMGNGLQARRSPFNVTLQRQLGTGPWSQVLDTDLTRLSSVAGAAATSLGLLNKQRQSASHDAEAAEKAMASHLYQPGPNNNFYQSLDEQQEDALHHFHLQDSQAASSTESQSQSQTNSNASGTTNELLPSSHGEAAAYEVAELSPHRLNRMMSSRDHPAESGARCDC